MTPHEYEILFDEPPPEDSVLSGTSDRTGTRAQPEMPPVAISANMTGVIVACALVAAIFVLGVIGVVTTNGA